MSTPVPLSEKLRPLNSKEIQGQDHIIGKEGLLTKLMSKKTPVSILLFGPPGSGKTTIARIYAKAFDLPYHILNSTHHGIQDIKKIIESKGKNPLFYKGPILLFIDELHRFNKAQQDLFLPYLEDGTLVLIGATTENPSFVINNALLSRLRVLTLNPLSLQDLDKILESALTKLQNLSFDSSAKNYLLELAAGDARHLCNLLETCFHLEEGMISLEKLETLLDRKRPSYDRDADGHYQLISALHKSIRGSDPQAALYYLARIMQGGEDFRFIARRLVRTASEDIGLADPEALSVALNAWEVYEKLGYPEGELALAQCVVYLALAPKSNSIYVAYKRAQESAQKTAHYSPPSHIINAANSWMKSEGYGKNYIYDHETKEGTSGQDYFPKEMERTEYYKPYERGFERELSKRLKYFDMIREQKKTSTPANPTS